MFFRFNISAYIIRFFVKVLIERIVNIRNELNSSRSENHSGWLAKFKQGVHSLCMRPNVVYTSINISDGIHTLIVSPCANQTHKRLNMFNTLKSAKIDQLNLQTT